MSDINAVDTNANTVRSETGLVQVELSKLDLDASRLVIKELAFHGYLNLRGSVENNAFSDAVTKVLNLSLPEQPNTFVSAQELTCLWLGPDEWLLITPPNQQAEFKHSLLSALDGVHAAVTDISGTNTMLDISGSATRDLIAKGTPLDIHSSIFGVGQCAQTSWIKTGVTLYQYSDAPGFRVIVRRSFADYFGVWLLDAVQEFTS